MRFAEPWSKMAWKRPPTMIVFALIAVIFCCASRQVFSEDIVLTGAETATKGDLDRDGDIDIDDLQIFSVKWFGVNWQDVDWCQWLEDNPKIAKHLGLLHGFIVDYFSCDGGVEPNEPPENPLAVKHKNSYPVRVAWGPYGYLYATDSKVGSVFIYDPNMLMIGELKGLNKPLGVAVDSLGTIYVANNGNQCLEAYDFTGVKTATFGRGLVKMPNDLAVDRDDLLYVVDSKTETVWVFDPNNAVVRSIGSPGDGEAQFRFPVAVAIGYYTDEFGQEIGELYVADQGHLAVKVFDLEGNFLRSFGGEVLAEGWWTVTWKWQGKFVKVQSLAIDSLGRLHASDCFMNKVQILNGQTGAYIGYYGAPGELNLPLDIAINELGEVAVANHRKKRVEIIYTVTAP